MHQGLNGCKVAESSAPLELEKKSALDYVAFKILKMRLKMVILVFCT